MQRMLSHGDLLLMEKFRINALTTLDGRALSGSTWEPKMCGEENNRKWEFIIFEWKTRITDTTTHSLTDGIRRAFFLFGVCRADEEWRCHTFVKIREILGNHSSLHSRGESENILFPALSEWMSLVVFTFRFIKINFHPPHPHCLCISSVRQSVSHSSAYVSPVRQHEWVFCDDDWPS